MQQLSTNRRVEDRRGPRGGGRRASDAGAAPVEPPRCPNCFQERLAVLAGESDGGWWFVCVDCDHLWDQRLIAGNGPVPSPPDVSEQRRSVSDLIRKMISGCVPANSARNLW